MPRELWTAASDLVWGTSCVACASPGTVLCGPCSTVLDALPFRANATVRTRGLPPVYSVAWYAGAVTNAVNAHKEDGCLALVNPLGRALALSVLAVLADAPWPIPAVRLVPMPTAAATVRARGHDPLLRIARRCTRSLAADGVSARVAPVLRLSRGVRDQSRLDADQRRDNLAGAFAMRRRRSLGDLPAVVVDDVVTTGATAAEAVRALERGGADVLGVAVIAATPRPGHPPTPRA